MKKKAESVIPKPASKLDMQMLPVRPLKKKHPKLIQELSKLVAHSTDGATAMAFPATPDTLVSIAGTPTRTTKGKPHWTTPWEVPTGSGWDRNTNV